MRTKFVERTNAKGRDIEYQFDEQNKLILMLRSSGDESFAISWRHSDGRWYYQSLHWSCRGGKAFWYRPLITFYRYIRQNKITDYNLRYLAWADRRLKNGGYAVGTDSHLRYQEIGRRLKLSREREAAISSGLNATMTALKLKEPWRLEQARPDIFVLQWPTRAYGEATGFVVVRLAIEAIVVQRTQGLSNRPNEADPFRAMLRMRKELEPEIFHDREMAPEQLVAAAMACVSRLMQEHEDATASLVAKAA